MHMLLRMHPAYISHLRFIKHDIKTLLSIIFSNIEENFTKHSMLYKNRSPLLLRDHPRRQIIFWSRLSLGLWWPVSPGFLTTLHISHWWRPEMGLVVLSFFPLTADTCTQAFPLDKISRVVRCKSTSFDVRSFVPPSAWWCSRSIGFLHKRNRGRKLMFQ